MHGSSTPQAGSGKGFRVQGCTCAVPGLRARSTPSMMAAARSTPASWVALSVVKPLSSVRAGAAQGVTWQAEPNQCMSRHWYPFACVGESTAQHTDRAPPPCVRAGTAGRLSCGHGSATQESQLHM